MNKIAKFLSLSVVLVLLACSKNEPGPIAGVWQADDFPMKTEFRAGETETMGMIEKVEYEVKDSDVIVTYTNGMAKGTAMRYTVVDKNTLKTEMGLLHRVQ
jgi:hypothetical protein